MDNGNGDDDAKLDIESIEDKSTQLKAIEALAFDQDQFEDIQRDFNEFCQSIVDVNNLKKFKVEYTGIYKALVASHKNEQLFIADCKSQISKIWESAQNVKSAIRMAANEVDKIEEIKRRVEEETNKVAVRKEESEQKQEQIAALRADIAALERKANEHHELEEDIKLRQLQNEKGELEKQKEEQQLKFEAMRLRNQQLLQEVLASEAKISAQIAAIEGYHTQIHETKELKFRIEREKVELEDQTTNARAKKIEENRVVKQLDANIIQTQKQCDERRKELIDEEEKLVACKASIIERKKKQAQQEKDKKKLASDIESKTNTNKDHQKTLDNVYHDISIVEKEKEKLLKELDHKSRKRHKMQCVREENGHTQEDLKLRSQVTETEYKRLKLEVQSLQKDIEQKIRERKLLNNDVVEAEAHERLIKAQKQDLDNQKTEQSFKIAGCEAESKRLSIIIGNLSKEKEKYGVEASQQNAKYYQCLEQVKLKNNLIHKLQKKNAEQEARLKQQLNLYEAVRSDRSLYAKNLLEAEEEIAELKMKFKRMTSQINQLKEEISTKDNLKQQEDANEAQYQKENKKLETQIHSINQQIASSDDMIKTQDNDISRLKYVISEAEGEKLKQKKDYEMVINERDILCTQLIKRDEELSLLYEKIKIQKSTLKKGENYYQEKIDDIIRLVQTIKETKRELNDAEMETECIPDLKREIYLLQKELLEAQQKAKFLSDELQKPLNVHRWRKLESTDIDTYELIQKIQSLQKRLIAKTEEVAEKDVLIQEKEKLYIELKNILAKQSGPEVTEKLVLYQQSLKERSKQLKEMIAEIKHFQSQAHEYKFEIERIDGQIQQCKDHYFALRRQQQLGVIPEMGNEEDMGGEIDPQQQQYQERHQQQMRVQQMRQQDQPPMKQGQQQDMMLPGGQPSRAAAPPQTQELDPEDQPI